MSEPRTFIIAIDGGAASGKSSTARGVSERLGVLHVDTGSHYRLLTRHLLLAGARPDDLPGVEAALSRIQLGTTISGRSAVITANGCTPGEEIRAPEVNASVSAFAALPAVRTFLMDYQRGQAALAAAHGFPGLVMEGRDIGTVIFPRADLKVFLTADPEARERRRAAEGQTDSIASRDRADSGRATAPLARAADAVVIDSTHLTLQDVIGRVAELARSALDSRKA